MAAAIAETTEWSVLGTKLFKWFMMVPHTKLMGRLNFEI